MFHRRYYMPTANPFFRRRAEQICDIQYGKQAGERGIKTRSGEKEDAEDELLMLTSTIQKKSLCNAEKKWPAKKRKSISNGACSVQESEKQTRVRRSTRRLYNGYYAQKQQCEVLFRSG